MRFVQVKNFEEVNSLPPELTLTFDRACNQSVQKVIREDQILPSGRVIVNVGILMNEIDAPCDGILENERASAGLLFSGREYEVKAIAK